MQNIWSCISNSGYFINRINRIKNISKDSVLVTTNMIGLYLSIPHVPGSKSPKNALDTRKNHSIPTEKLVKLAEFTLQNNVLKIETVKEKILIRTKCKRYVLNDT